MTILPPPSAPDTSSPIPSPKIPLDPEQRLHVAVAALAGHSITSLAEDHQVSRKCVYQQAERARQALTHTFAPPPPPAEKVLFQLPVTRSWLRQFSLGLLLIGHCSLRGVHELLRDLLDVDYAVGTVHNVLHDAVATARTINADQDLSAVHRGAHDEIFQNGQPVLVGADVRSTYCYLLRQAEQRDGDTWAIHLLDLQAQGFRPSSILGDAGTGLRAGLALAFPDVPWWADIFHAERELGLLVQYARNRAFGVMKATAKLERQVAQRTGRGQADPALVRQWEGARHEETAAIALADDLAVLETWLRQDILAVAGPPLEERQALFAFVLAELRQREALCAHRIGPVVRFLANQQQALLAFAEFLDWDILSLAAYCRVSPEVIRMLVTVQTLPLESGERWQRQGRLQQQLGDRFAAVSALVAEMLAQVVRASSVVENLNSRLRNYFFLRRHLGPEYLELLQFFLNHRRFLRSERPERVGKSPREVLTGQDHAHWLELLGYTRFRRAS